MLRALASDTLIVGITEDNVREILNENPLYVQNDDLGLDFDIQIVLENSMAVGIEGRMCLTNAFSKESLEDLRKGQCRLIEKTGTLPYSVLIFYGKDLEALQLYVNEATGRATPPVELGKHEYYMEKKQNGKTVVERGTAPSSIFRNGKSHHVF
jgi:hypothetical protein